MKVSELTQTLICEHCHIVESDLTESEAAHLGILQEAAVSYCAAYTGLTEEQLDEHEDITVAVLVLISDMFDNRQMYVDKANVNRVVDSILGMHCLNLIPDEIETPEPNGGSGHVG